jgi:hypothetical protein
LSAEPPLAPPPPQLRGRRRLPRARVLQGDRVPRHGRRHPGPRAPAAPPAARARAPALLCARKPHAAASTLHQSNPQWLSYWVCYAVFSFLETALWPLLRWVPLYGAARVAALLWLAAPQFKGATLVYRAYARPLILAAAERAREVPALAPYVEGLAPARPAAAAAAAAGDKFSEVAGAAEERFAQLKAHAQ